MKEFTQLIRDDVLDKEQLVLKRYHFLDIDKIQATYIAKIYSNKDYNSDLTLKEMSNLMEIPLNSVEVIVKELLKKNLIIVKNEGESLSFNFDLLINKLINSYIAPSNDKEPEEILNWIIKTVNFEISNSNKEDLRLIISENGWENLKEVINRLSTLDNQTWHQMISMYESLGIKTKSDSNKIKEILDKNWLE